MSKTTPADIQTDLNNLQAAAAQTVADQATLDSANVNLATAQAATTQAQNTVSSDLTAQAALLAKTIADLQAVYGVVVPPG